MKEYALYKGDEILAIGTLNEIAKEMNLKKQTLMVYGTPSRQRKNKGNARILISLEDGKESDTK